MKKWLILGCGGMAVLVAGAVFLAYLGVNALTARLVNTLTSPQPVSLPASELSNEKIRDLEAKIARFQQTLDAGEEARLEMESDEFNHWLKEAATEKLRDFPGLPAWDRMVHTEFTNRMILTRISVPLDALGEILFLKSAKGRYFNGIALLEPKAGAGGRIQLDLRELQVNGEAVPKDKLKPIESDGKWDEFSKDPEVQRWLDSVQSVDIDGDRLILISKKPLDEASTSNRSSVRD